MSNDKLREALAFYGDMHNWQDGGFTRTARNTMVMILSSAMKDRGDLARAALAAAPAPAAQAASSYEDLLDKIDGLESDLDNAVETAIRRGAIEWGRLNYPNHPALKAAPQAASQPDPDPDPEREGLVKGGFYLDPTGYATPQPIHAVLSRQASQENCDGEPYDAMMFAADYIKRLEDALIAAAPAQRPAPGERETLAEAIKRAHHRWWEQNPTAPSVFHAVADALLAAGYRRIAE